MDVKRKFYPLTNDYVFKKVLISRPDALRRLLELVLGVPRGSLGRIRVADTNLEPATPEGHRGILDIRVEAEDGGVTDVEMQVEREPGLAERAFFYLGGLFVDRLPRNVPYAKVGRVSSIIITGFEMFPGRPAWHARLRMADLEQGIVLSDNPAIHILDLTRLPQGDGDELVVLLRLFTLRTEEDFMEYARMHPENADPAMDVVRLNLDETDRIQAARWEKAQRDEVNRILGSKLEERMANALALLRNGVDAVLVSESLRIPLEEVLRLKKDLQ